MLYNFSLWSSSPELSRTINESSKDRIVYALVVVAGYKFKISTWRRYSLKSMIRFHSFTSHATLPEWSTIQFMFSLWSPGPWLSRTINETFIHHFVRKIWHSLKSHNNTVKYHSKGGYGKDVACGSAKSTFSLIVQRQYLVSYYACTGTYMFNVVARS